MSKLVKEELSFKLNEYKRYDDIDDYYIELIEYLESEGLDLNVINDLIIDNGNIINSDYANGYSVESCGNDLIKELNKDKDKDKDKDKLSEEANDNVSFLYKVLEILPDNVDSKRLLGIFRAGSKEEAKQLASEYFDDEEIAKYGFYVAEETTQQELNREKTKLQYQLSLYNIIN